MKKILFIGLGIFSQAWVFGQSAPQQLSTKDQRRAERKERVQALMKQDEEGALVFERQRGFHIKAASNGWGFGYELGKFKNRRTVNLLSFEFAEIKDPKEDKISRFQSSGFLLFQGNPFVYGKQNIFYQVKVGLGQQYLLGQPGNKNGVGVYGFYQGGLSLGLLRPYYLEVVNAQGFQQEIKYSVADSALFFSDAIQGGTGLRKGWNEMKFQPGAYLRTGLRFDYGRFRESLQQLEVGLQVEGYAKEIPIMVNSQQRQFFFSSYVALRFGRRK